MKCSGCSLVSQRAGPTAETSCEGCNSGSTEICGKTVADFNEVNHLVVKRLE